MKEGSSATGELAGLAVRGVLAAVRAELVQLDAVRVVPAVLLGDVVPVLAVHTGQRDLGTNVGASHGNVPFIEERGKRANPKVSRGPRISQVVDRRPGGPRLSVAAAGLEPATQRL